MNLYSTTHLNRPHSIDSSLQLYFIDNFPQKNHVWDLEIPDRSYTSDFLI